VQRGHQKGRSLPCSGLSLPRDVVTRQGGGERLGLDRRAADKGGVGETPENALIEIEGIEPYVR
jgi:hypothetical protein